jgi:hypothetical protein
MTLLCDCLERWIEDLLIHSHDEMHNVKDEEVEEAATDEGDYECEGFWVHNAAVNQRMNCDAGMLHWQSKTYALYQYHQAQIATVTEILSSLWVLWQLSSSFISDLIVSGPRPGKEALVTAAAHTSVAPPPSQINK